MGPAPARKFSSLGNVFNLQLVDWMRATQGQFSSLGNVFNLQHEGDWTHVSY